MNEREREIAGYHNKQQNRVDKLKLVENTVTVVCSVLRL